jgi:MFS family permease
METTQIPSPARRALTRSDYKTLTLAALGGALEFYDFVIFVFFAATLGQLFFPSDIPDWLRQLQTFGIFAAGYVARPLGGIVMAHFGDLFGRKRMFTLSVLLMAMPTLLIGLLPTYTDLGVIAPILLLLLRVLQGAAVGGEVPGAWVFVAEHVPAHRAGFACGTLTSGLTIGILLGSLIASAINRHYAPDEVTAFAWRIPFLLGGAFGLLAVWLRRWLHETPVFAEMQARRTLAAELPLKAVLRSHVRAVGLSILLTWMLSAAIAVIVLMTPTLLQKQFHLAPLLTLQANSMATLGLAVGCLCAGALADRFGLRAVLIPGGLLLAASYAWMLIQLGADTTALVPLYTITGFLVGTVGAVPLALVRSFPPAVRFSGMAFSYNFAWALFGGLTPVAVSLMLKSHALAPALYVAIVCVIGALAALLHRNASTPA